MIVELIAEILSGDNKRLIYSEDDNIFLVEKFNNIFMKDKLERYVYGWILGCGSPPNKHLDVLMITNKQYNLGDKLTGKVIGVFYRIDGDHKIVCLEQDDNINDITELSNNDKELLKNLYSGKYYGDAWLNSEDAEEIIKTGHPIDKTIEVGKRSVFKLQWKTDI